MGSAWWRCSSSAACCLLFNYPLLSLLNFAGDAFGVPAERGLRHAQAVPGTV